MANSEKRIGLLIVYTGNGKGKTTAALGMCVRAVGYGWRVCVLQFVKGSWKSGEQKGIKRLAPEVEMRTIGKGFVGIIGDDKPIVEHQEAARLGLLEAEQILKSQEFELVILDELCVALQLGLVTREAVQAVLDSRGKEQHLLVTGRGAPDWLIEAADLVTEMKEIKHPFQNGVEAQKGVDW